MLKEANSSLLKEHLEHLDKNKVVLVVEVKTLQVATTPEESTDDGKLILKLCLKWF